MNAPPLRILMLIHRLADNSPYCLFVHDQARALRAIGHEVTVLSPVGTLPLYRFLRPHAWRIMHSTPRQVAVDGIPVYHPRYAALGDAGVRLLGGWPLYRAVLPIARRLHRSAPFDIIHAHMLPVEGHAGLLLGRALGLPVALTVHGTDVMRYFSPSSQPWPRNRNTAEQVSALMAVSGKLARLLAPYRSAPIEVVSNGIDLSSFPTEHRRMHQRLLAGAAFRRQKCMHTTVEAFCALATEFPQATLTVFGDGPERATLEHIIAAYGMESRVTLTGVIPHADVLRLMADSDAFLMPSYNEGFGIVYLEAMAAGCVAVGSQGEGISDLIVDGENGYLVPAGDIAALIPVMRTLLIGGPHVEAVRARGTDAARALTWAHNAAQSTEIYRRAIAAHPRGTAHRSSWA